MLNHHLGQGEQQLTKSWRFHEPLPMKVRACCKFSILGKAAHTKSAWSYAGSIFPSLFRETKQQGPGGCYISKFHSWDDHDIPRSMEWQKTRSQEEHWRASSREISSVNVLNSLGQRTGIIESVTVWYFYGKWKLNNQTPPLKGLIKTRSCLGSVR